MSKLWGAVHTEGGLFYTRYLLDTKDSETAGYTKDWYIKERANVDPAEKPTTTVSSVMSAASLNYHTWRTQMDKLMQRMGDLRKGGGENNGAWFRFGGSKLDSAARTASRTNICTMKSAMTR